MLGNRAIAVVLLIPKYKCYTSSSPFRRGVSLRYVVLQYINYLTCCTEMPTLSPSELGGKVNDPTAKFDPRRGTVATNAEAS